MSADNGIYILETLAENEGCECDEVQDDMLQRYYGNCEAFSSKTAALEKACELERDCYILEYGISFIRVNRQFPK
jgi:hypothetical protein